MQLAEIVRASLQKRQDDLRRLVESEVEKVVDQLVEERLNGNGVVQMDPPGETVSGPSGPAASVARRSRSTRSIRIVTSARHVGVSGNGDELASGPRHPSPRSLDHRPRPSCSSGSRAASPATSSRPSLKPG